ncbi:MAG: SBBP repeat-containing protein [Candidatus Thorarchaeota archaeon]
MNRKQLLVLSCLALLVISLPLSAAMSDQAQNVVEKDEGVLQEDSAIVEKATQLSNTHFLQNNGQIGIDRIQFYSVMPGGSIGFAESEILLIMQDNEEIATLTFLGANNVAPKGISENSQTSNYFLGDRGSYQNVASYQRIMYHNLWDGIDLIYKTTPEGVKYQFDVMPGANPSIIQIQVDGSGTLLIDEESVKFETMGENFVDEGLVAIQGDERIQASFSKIESNTFGFEVGAYDHSAKLIIDPLLYSTYIGGSGGVSNPVMAIDDEGYIYVAGTTDSSDFPIVNGFNDTLWGIQDIFIFKLDPTGTNLIYSTYVGGSEFESAESIAIDGNGNVYVAGDTFSSDFPTTDDALNNTYNGLYDAVVFKLNSTGNGLEYSTYYGGSQIDRTNTILLDNDGSVYVFGRTESPDFPTKNALNYTLNGGYDLYVFKLNSTMTGVEYSTYLGGIDDEFADNIDLDDNGNIYILGSSASLDYPTTPGALNTTSNGEPDIVVSKLNSTGNGLIYSTYVGSADWDAGNYLVANPTGDVYVVGVTESTDFPTLNAYNDTSNGLNDAVVFKLNATGNGLLYSTYLGGSVDESPRVLCIDSQGNAFIALVTDSPDFPVVSAFDNSLDGATDIAIVKLNSTGNGLDFSSYFGGEDEDKPTDMILIPNGIFYVCGETSSVQDFPLMGAYDYSFNGGDDVFILKYAIDESSPSINSPQNIVYTYKDTGNYIQWLVSDPNPARYQLTINGYTGQWQTWDGGSLSFNIDNLDTGVYTYTLTVEDTIGHSNQDTVVVTVLPDTTAPNIDSPIDAEFELGTSGLDIIWNVGDRSPDGYTIEVIQSSQTSILMEYSSWVNGTISFSLDDLAYGIYNVTLTVFDENGNSVNDTVEVTVVDTHDPAISTPSDITYVEGTSGETIDWVVSDLSPYSYEITRNGTTVAEGTWDGSSISIEVGSLSPGVYTFTLVVRDAAGNLGSDSVIVTVSPSNTTPSDGEIPPYLIIVAGGGGAIVIIVIIIVALKKKG